MTIGRIRYPRIIGTPKRGRRPRRIARALRLGRIAGYGGKIAVTANPHPVNTFEALELATAWHRGWEAGNRARIVQRDGERHARGEAVRDRIREARRAEQRSMLSTDEGFR